MSLILDALRRSEEERKEQAEPISAIYTAPARFERPSSAGLWMLLVLLLAGFAGAVFWLLREPAPEPREAPAAVAGPQPVAAEARPEAPMQSAGPAAETPPAAATAAPAQPAEPPTRREVPRSLEEEARLAAPPKPRVTLDEPQAPPTAPVSPTSGDVAGPSPKAAANRAQTREAAKPDPIEKMSELPEGIRERLERFEVNTHFFSPVPGKSFALINMRKYREGEDLEGTTYRIRAITADGIVVDYGAGSVLMGMTRE